MKMFIITGYSGKMDGILVAIPAATLEGAFKKLPSATQKLVDVPNHGLFLCDKDEDDAYIKESVENGELRWFWQLSGQELKYGVNLHEAVQW